MRVQLLHCGNLALHAALFAATRHGRTQLSKARREFFLIDHRVPLQAQQHLHTFAEGFFYHNGRQGGRFGGLREACPPCAANRGLLRWRRTLRVAAFTAER